MADKDFSGWKTDSDADNWVLDQNDQLAKENFNLVQECNQLLDEEQRLTNLIILYKKKINTRYTTLNKPSLLYDVDIEDRPSFYDRCIYEELRSYRDKTEIYGFTRSHYLLSENSSLRT